MLFTSSIEVMTFLRTVFSSWFFIIPNIKRFLTNLSLYILTGFSHNKDILILSSINYKCQLTAT